MSLNLENASGLTAQFGNAVYANSAAGNSNVSTTNVTTYAIAGFAYNVAAKAAAAFTNLNDFRTGLLPVAVLGGQAAVVVVGLDATGALQFVQGPVVAYNLVNPTVGQTVLPWPSLPNGFCPIAYQVIRNKNTAGTAGFTFGTSLFNAANVTLDAAVQIAQLPNYGITNVSVA